MSSAVVRAVVQQFFLQPPIPGLPEVRRAWDNQMQLIANGMTPEQTTSCVRIVEESERRIATPAAQPGQSAGIRFVDYTVHLAVCHFFDGSGDEAVDSLDDLIEDIKVRLRSDPRLGQTPDVIFESAQGENPQINVFRGETTWINTGLAAGVPITWFGVEWLVTQQIAA